MIHTGQLIQSVLHQQGKTVTWFAQQLCCTRTNVYKIFQKKNLDVEIIWRASGILKYYFFKKISEELKNMDIYSLECGCVVDKNGRMRVEIICRNIAGVRLNRLKLLRMVELCCDRDFDPPTVTESAGKLYILLTERAMA